MSAITPSSENASKKTTGGAKPRFKSNWLRWPVSRLNRTFRVYVVEPGEYRPEGHAEIFYAALNNFFHLESTVVDPFTDETPAKGVESFDLLTFPEAFLPLDTLLVVLDIISGLKSFGCVHVGLRPSEADGHLFATHELLQLVDAISTIPQIVGSDLTPFSNWLGDQPADGSFNIGCLFTIDAHQQVRVCLHPKILRSKFETSPFEERYMIEADLLTIVTLQPEEKALLSVTIQPLICSDTLLLDTDRPHCRPLEAVTVDANCFGDTPPEHVDIVSVVTCTPQTEMTNQEQTRRQWHESFRESFRRAALDDALARHHHATFILSNFSKLPNSRAPGGLSGAFIPVPLRFAQHPFYVTVSSWGRMRVHDGADNRWTQPHEGSLPEVWSSLGYVASLDSTVAELSPYANMLGFTIERLPRDTSRWKPARGLADFQLRKAFRDADTQTLFFGK